MYEEFETKLQWFSGRITEPTIKYFESGSVNCTFAVVLKENKDSKECTFLNCQLWGDVAEKFPEQHKKGDFITVGGVIAEREYNGKTYYDFNVKVLGV